MSNRSRFEINHDCFYEIERHPLEFRVTLIEFLGTMSEESIQRLRRFGLIYEGTRHHSDPWPKQEASHGE